MGYSFSAPCKSRKARDKMMRFLKQHYRPWADVISPFRDKFVSESVSSWVGFETYARGPLTEDLSYDDGACKIGFDYGSTFSQEERYWMYNFCYWLAQRVGRRRTSRKAPGCGAVPYVLYDGHEMWPVLEASTYGSIVGTDSKWLVEDGFRGMTKGVEKQRRVHHENCVTKGMQLDSNYIAYLDGQAVIARIVDFAIKTELDRLMKLWESVEDPGNEHQT